MTATPPPASDRQHLKVYAEAIALSGRARREQKAEQRVPVADIVSAVPTVSTSAEDARARREKAAERRSLTATFFGDPPPGYSALDRKRDAASHD